MVCEKIPYVKSVSVGIWVKTGSRNENPENSGVSHFIEHMLFKGTAKRTAAGIAECIDNIGGQLNAFTGKECTCFYTKTLDEHIDLAVDVLSDMLFNSLFSKKNVALEKKVILEEIGMYEDSPEELVHDILSEAAWNGSSIGYPILGTKKSLRRVGRESMLSYMSERYIPGNTVISVAGNFDEAALEGLLEKYFGSWQRDAGKIDGNYIAKFTPGIKIKEKDTEQVHLCIGFEGLEIGDERLYPLLAVNNIFGGGMSSRLFQKIREKKGLVYSIYSYPTSYLNGGLFTIYAGMKPERLSEVINLIFEETLLLKRKGFTSRELEKSKEQLKGNYILGLESTSSIMNSIGKSELLLGYADTREKILQKINQIDMDSVKDVINSIFDTDRKAMSVVGNIRPNIDLKAFM